MDKLSVLFFRIWKGV